MAMDKKIKPNLIAVIHSEAKVDKNQHRHDQRYKVSYHSRNIEGKAVTRHSYQKAKTDDCHGVQTFRKDPIQTLNRRGNLFKIYWNKIETKSDISQDLKSV